MSTDIKSQLPLETLKTIGIVFGAITPISIIIGSAIILSYLSKNKADAYIVDALANPNTLIYLAIAVGGFVTLSGTAFICSYIFMSEFKIGEKSLYEHLKEHYKDECKKEVATLIFFYSSLMAISIFIISFTFIIDFKFTLLAATGIVTVIASTSSLWIIEKKKSTTYFRYLVSLFSLRRVAFNEISKNLSFFPLIGVNIFSISTLFLYIPRVESLENKYGNLYFAFSFLALITIIYAINYFLVIFTQKNAFYITTAILFTIILTNMHYDDNDSLARYILRLSEDRSLIIKGETVNSLSLDEISEQLEQPNLYSISYKKVIISTNDSIIVKINDSRIASIPKSRMLGEISHVKQSSGAS